MSANPFTLENHSTAGCNKFSSPRQILPNWIRCVIAVLWLSKVYGHNPIHFRKSQYSWLQQILITKTNSSKLDTMCNSCYYGPRKCMGTIPFTLENHCTAGCNKFSSPRQILPNWIRCIIAVTMALESVWGQLHSP